MAKRSETPEPTRGDPVKALEDAIRTAGAFKWESVHIYLPEARGLLELVKKVPKDK